MTTTTSEATESAGGYREVFASGQFRALFGAYVVSLLGQIVTQLAITVLVYRQTGSALLSALAFTMSFAPQLIGGTLLAGLADRLPPRRLIAGSDLIAAAFVLLMAVPGLPVVALLGLVFLSGLFVPLATGSRGAMLPRILPERGIVPGRSLLRIVAQGAQVSGWATGGILLAALPSRGVLIIAGAAFLCSATILRICLREQPPSGARKKTPGRKGGLREVFALPGLAPVLLMFWMVPFFEVWPEGLAAPYVDRLGLPDAAAGWWLTALPAGTIVGELAGVWLLTPARRRRLTRPLAFACLTPLVFFAFSPGLAPALVLLVLAGLASAFMLGLDQRLLDITPESMLGRVYSVNSAAMMTSQGMGFAAAGALGEFIAPHLVITTGACAGLLGLVFVRLPSRARSQASTPSP